MKMEVTTKTISKVSFPLVGNPSGGRLRTSRSDKSCYHTYEFLSKKIRSYEVEGFTLIELLVSLAILTVVIGAVYSSFFSVHRAVERFDNVSVKYHEARTALDIMRREIEGALVKNPRADDESKVKAVFVVKDRDVFGKNASFLNLTAFSFKGSNPNTISYFTEEKDGKLDLLKTEAPASIPSKEFKMEIIEGIEGFTVETLFNNKWVRTWDTFDTGALPEIVKVTIEFDDNGKPVKLTEYARPRIGNRL